MSELVADPPGNAQKQQVCEGARHNYIRTPPTVRIDFSTTSGHRLYLISVMEGTEISPWHSFPDTFVHYARAAITSHRDHFHRARSVEHV